MLAAERGGGVITASKEVECWAGLSAQAKEWSVGSSRKMSEVLEAKHKSGIVCQETKGREGKGRRKSWDSK